MQIRRFTGTTMPEALKAVKAALGSEAVILDTASGPNGIVVTAAVDHEPDAPRSGPASDGELVAEVRRLVSTIQELVSGQWGGPHVDPDLVALHRRLVGQGVDAEIAAALVRATAPRLEHAGALEAALAGTLATAEPRAAGRVQLLLGAPGDGKTTTAVKLAVQARRAGRRVALVTTDTYRVGAAVELETYGRALGVPVARAVDGAELGMVLGRLDDADLVLVDTAGAGPGQESALAELADLAAAAGPEAGRVLVASAATGGRAAATAWDAFARLAPDACVVTKLDVAGGGPLLGLCWRRGVRVSHVAAGRNVSADLEVATPERLARCLLAA